MRLEQVEIYSDTTNAAIVRHPERRFPGVLIQGDTLHGMFKAATRAMAAARESTSEEACDEMAELQDQLAALVEHYKRTLGEHGLELPFLE